jgi:hypothetical protein
MDNNWRIDTEFFDNKRSGKKKLLQVSAEAYEDYLHWNKINPGFNSFSG